MTTPHASRRPRVFLIAEPSFKKHAARGGTLPNLTPLLEHGELRALITTADPRPIDFPMQAMQLIEQRLSEFDPDTDALAWGGGDTVTAFLAGVALERRGVNHVTWLRYDRARTLSGERTDDGAKYVPVAITLFHDGDPEDET